LDEDETQLHVWLCPKAKDELKKALHYFVTDLFEHIQSGKCATGDPEYDIIDKGFYKQALPTEHQRLVSSALLMTGFQYLIA
jgi:hypothetical protein